MDLFSPEWKDTVTIAIVLRHFLLRIWTPWWRRYKYMLCGDAPWQAITIRVHTMIQLESVLRMIIQENRRYPVIRRDREKLTSDKERKVHGCFSCLQSFTCIDRTCDYRWWTLRQVGKWGLIIHASDVTYHHNFDSLRLRGKTKDDCDDSLPSLIIGVTKFTRITVKSLFHRQRRGNVDNLLVYLHRKCSILHYHPQSTKMFKIFAVGVCVVSLVSVQAWNDP
jgi:hypothetical protein